MNCWKLRLYSLIICIICISANGICQTTVNISASKDNTLYENVNGLLSNGMGQHFFAGNNAGASNENTRRGLIQFDIAGNIPAGALITQVELSLHAKGSANGFQDIELRRVLEDWGEGSSDAPGDEEAGTASATNDATWRHRFYTSSVWDNLGGTFSGQVSATTSVGSIGDYTWNSNQMVNDVQDWLMNPSSNFGWMLRGNESSSSTMKGFDTKDHPTAADRPVLSVTYIPTSFMAIPAAKDNTLFESESGGTSNGIGEFLFTGRSVFGNVIRRAVIQFDLNGTIPPGSTIEGVILSMNMTFTVTSDQTLNLHKLTMDWGEGTSDGIGSEEAGAASTVGDATWLHRFFNSLFWTNVGGDFNGTSSASTAVGAEGIYSWGSTTEMVGDVQAWVDNPATNFGWIIIGNEAVGQSIKRFNSRENTNTPPVLYVFYRQPVPVELIDFSAVTEGRNVILEWETATEIDNQGFEIEHSTNGSRFTSIGFVEGAGNSSNRINYTYRDRNPAIGNNFYRLKQLDTNGKFEYSPVVKAEIKDFSDLKGLLVFPNPSNDFIQVQQLNAIPSLIKVYNSSASLIRVFQLEDGERNTKVIDITEWPIGKYFIQGSNGEQAEFIKIH